MGFTFCTTQSSISDKFKRMLRSLLVSLFPLISYALIIEHAAVAPSMSGPIPAFFAGFSVEWSDLRRTFLVDSRANYSVDQAVDASLLNPETIKVSSIYIAFDFKLFSNFQLAGNNESSTVLLRIGGNSSIAVWVTGSHITPRLATQTVNVSSFDLRVLDIVANITGAKVCFFSIMNHAS